MSGLVVQLIAIGSTMAGIIVGFILGFISGRNS